MADVISKTINTQIRKLLNDGTYQVEHPETKIENVLGKATKAEAETGANNTKYMTPLRVREGILKLGVKTSVFSGSTLSQSAGGDYQDLVIPLGKSPEKYIKLEGQGALDSMGVCFIDIAEGKAYIHEVYAPNSTMEGHRIEYDLGSSSKQSVCFLGAGTSSGDARLNRISVSNDKLTLNYFIYSLAVGVSNILVEVL